MRFQDRNSSVVSTFSFNILPQALGDTCLGVVVNRGRPCQCLMNCLHIVCVLVVVLSVPGYGDA